MNSQKHPPALYLLSATAAGERFAYYGMRALLILYMVAGVTGVKSGMNFSEGVASNVYGVFNGLCYLFPFFGGILADRIIGERKSVIIGGILILMGLIFMSLNDNLVLFIAGLTLIAMGNGFYKPTIVSMIGSLYEQGDPRRDNAYTLYYQLFNGAVFFAPIVCGAISIMYGYRAGFLIAGVAVALSLFSYLFLAGKYLGNVGLTPKGRKTDDLSTEKVKLTKEDRDRISVIFTMLFFVTFFWAGYEQAGSSLSLYTEKYIDRNVLGFEIPTPWFQSVNPVLVLIFGFMFSALWSFLSKKGKNPSTPVKMGMGMILLGIGFLFMLGAVAQRGGENTDLTVKAGMIWLILTYLFHTFGELMLSPIGLSMVSKLAPAKTVSMFMGIWFFSFFIAHVIGGLLASEVNNFGAGTIFSAVAIFVILLGLIVFLISRKLLERMHGRD